MTGEEKVLDKIGAALRAIVGVVADLRRRLQRRVP